MLLPAANTANDPRLVFVPSMQGNSTNAAGKASGSNRYTGLAADVLLAGHDRVISFPGTSQFRVQGVSACGLAALNFARIVFRRIEDHRGDIGEVLNDIGSRNTVEEIISICGGWSSESHLEVEEICQVPLFEKSLKLLTTRYGLPRPKHFKRVLSEMKANKLSAVVIITRPPEIIACFKVASATSENAAFVVFDSHPRPSHPHGAGLVFSTSVEQTAATLSSILPVDEHLLSSSDLQWQAQLLSHCSSHVFLARNKPLDEELSDVESSLSMLALRAQVKVLTQENDTLKADNERLETVISGLRDALEKEKQKAKRAVDSFTPVSVQKRAAGFRSQPATNAVAGPSRLGNGYDSWGYGFFGMFADKPPPSSPTGQRTHNQDEEHAENMQIDNSKDERKNLAYAMQLQGKFDAEDRRLRYEKAELSHYLQLRFRCGICLEDESEDNAARVDGCEHLICRTCMRNFLCQKIDEHRFPVLCPICVAEGGAREPSVIPGLLVEQIGVTEEQYRIWIEMELAQFSIMIHCRQCNRSAFVDRHDHNDMQNIVCPMQDCQHIWCKACQQTIVIGGPKHSCDGSSELDHLMKTKGWHYCPNCKTPILKESGCNHMTCITPGCNTHFCYVCGGLIVRSALKDEVNRAISTHYEKCKLFEVPE